jgi:hypothetical protein
MLVSTPHSIAALARRNRMPLNPGYPGSTEFSSSDAAITAATKPCAHPPGCGYQQGPGMPLEQVTVEPGGTTTVVFRGGGLSWKLRQPPRLKGISATSNNFFMRGILSG